MLLLEINFILSYLIYSDSFILIIHQPQVRYIIMNYLAPVGATTNDVVGHIFLYNIKKTNLRVRYYAAIIMIIIITIVVSYTFP